MEKIKTKSVITYNAELREYTNSKGLRQVAIRITQNKKHTRENTGISIEGKFWDGTHGKWISTKHPNHKKLNITIQEKLTQYQNAQLDLEKEIKHVNKEDVFNQINKEYMKTDFLAFWDAERKKMKEYNQWKGYDTTRNKIVEFHGSEVFDFRTVNKDWLERFEIVLRTSLGSVESVYTNLKRIRRMWNTAINEKVANKEYYPFGKNGFKMPSYSNKAKQIERLDTEELQAFFKLNYDKSSLIYFAKMGFELAFNCSGIRVEDLLTLKVCNTLNGRITYNMKKGVTNGKLKTFAITPTIQKILDELIQPNAKANDYLLPFLPPNAEQQSNEVYKKLIGSKTAMYNKYLKLIADDIGTPKKLTSHLARHSWSLYTYEKTGDLKFIQENLDHEDIKVTMGYIGRLSTKQNDLKHKDLLTDIYA